MGLWLLVSALTSFAAFTNTIGNIPQTGICGPSFSNDIRTPTLVLGPLCIILVTFLIFTPLSILSILKHIQHENMYGGTTYSNKQISKDLIHLNIRLIIYTIFVGSSCILFIIIIWQSLAGFDKAYNNWVNYLTCLYIKGELNKNECILGYTLPNYVYYSEGIICILISLASLLFSCSTKRMQKWKYNKVTNYVSSHIRSVTNSRKGTRVAINSTEGDNHNHNHNYNYNGIQLIEKEENSQDYYRMQD